MLHLKNSGFVPKDSTKLLVNARTLGKDLPVTIRDARVSSKFLEFDVSIKKEDLENLVERLKPIGTLDNAKHVVEEEKEKEDAIKEGVFYFNNERFWECHEVLEGVWKKCSAGEKQLVQGIILVAAALVHHQKNEDNICVSIFGRALEKLAKAQENYHGIDVDKIRSTITEMRKTGKVSTFEI